LGLGIPDPATNKRPPGPNQSLPTLPPLKQAVIEFSLTFYAELVFRTWEVHPFSSGSKRLKLFSTDIFLTHRPLSLTFSLLCHYHSKVVFGAIKDQAAMEEIEDME
jgi:hypothetical protein